MHELRVDLAELGYLPAGLAAGDRYDDAVYHGVMALQKIAGIGRDGSYGPVTRRVLERAVSTGARPRPTLHAPGRRIEVDLSDQVAKLIAADRVQRTIAISSGGPGHATPPGRFRVIRKELRSWSVPYRVWMPYASYFNAGIAFHAYPSVPAVAASHGCVRVPPVFAPEVYRFAALATPVSVLP